jgi:hypothetical protein
MGSMVVISMQPIGPHLSHFLPAVEDIAINHLGAVALVESLDTGVLRVGCDTGRCHCFVSTCVVRWRWTLGCLSRWMDIGTPITSTSSLSACHSTILPKAFLGDEHYRRAPRSHDASWTPYVPECMWWLQVVVFNTFVAHAERTIPLATQALLRPMPCSATRAWTTISRRCRVRSFDQWCP